MMNSDRKPSVAPDMRYSGLLHLDAVGEAGLEAIRSSRILVVGCGALGSLAAMYLAASGVGTLGIADFDTVDLSNLPRQLFFDEASAGQSKCTLLAERIRRQNSSVEVVEHRMLVTRAKALEVFGDYDFIVDGSDNPSTKLMADAVTDTLGIPCCIGGVKGFYGQAMTCRPGTTRYADVFGDSQADCSGVLPCSIAGVFGPVAGVIASVQASEALKAVVSAKVAGSSLALLTDRLFTVDLASATTRVIPVASPRY